MAAHASETQTWLLMAILATSTLSDLMAPSALIPLATSWMKWTRGKASEGEAADVTTGTSGNAGGVQPKSIPWSGVEQSREEEPP